MKYFFESGICGCKIQLISFLLYFKTKAADFSDVLFYRYSRSCCLVESRIVPIIVFIRFRKILEIFM